MRVLTVLMCLRMDFIWKLLQTDGLPFNFTLGKAVVQVWRSGILAEASFRFLSLSSADTSSQATASFFHTIFNSLFLESPRFRHCVVCLAGGII